MKSQPNVGNGFAFPATGLVRVPSARGSSTAHTAPSAQWPIPTVATFVLTFNLSAIFNSKCETRKMSSWLKFHGQSIVWCGVTGG